MSSIKNEILKEAYGIQEANYEDKFALNKLRGALLEDYKYFGESVFDIYNSVFMLNQNLNEYKKENLTKELLLEYDIKSVDKYSKEKREEAAKNTNSYDIDKNMGMEGDFNRGFGTKKHAKVRDFGIESRKEKAAAEYVGTKEELDTPKEINPDAVKIVEAEAKKAAEEAAKKIKDNKGEPSTADQERLKLLTDPNNPLPAPKGDSKKGFFAGLWDSFKQTGVGKWITGDKAFGGLGKMIEKNDYSGIFQLPLFKWAIGIGGAAAGIALLRKIIKSRKMKKEAKK